MTATYDCSVDSQLLTGMRLARGAIGRGELVVLPTDVVELRDADGVLLRELPTDGSVHGLRAAIDELDRSAHDGVDGRQVTIRRPSLDDVFLAITGGGRDPRDADREASAPELIATN